MKELAHLRKLKGLTVRGLAKKSDVAAATITAIENGRRPRPPPTTARKLADALEVEIPTLYGEAYPKGKAPQSEGAGQPSEAKTVELPTGVVGPSTRRLPGDVTVTRAGLEEAIEALESGRVDLAREKLEALKELVPA